MNVLFFSPNAVNEHNDIKGTGNWVGSLLQAIDKYDTVLKEITVAFHDKSIKEVQYSKVGCYHIVKLPTEAASTNIGKLIDNWTVKDIYKHSLPDYIEVINKVQPDIIQLFGIEHPYIRVIGKTDIPVVIHLQGMIGPYQIKQEGNKRHKIYQLLKSKGLKNIIAGNITFLRNKIYRRHLSLEEKIYNKVQYYFGRTDWDKYFSKSVSPNSKYFYCQEIMRDIFYQKQWKSNGNNVFNIYSTLGDSLRKNVDVIYRTEQILKQNNEKFEIQWNIGGLNKKGVMFKLIKNSGLNSDRINLLGRLSSGEIVNQMMDSDLFVFPSAIDNSPNALQEAMLIGMPIIATHAGGISSLIDHEESGLLIPEGEPYSLAGAIVDLFQNFDEAKKMGANARKVALKRNDPQNVVQSLVSNFQKIIEKHRAE